jgi:serine protease AprX
MDDMHAAAEEGSMGQRPDPLRVLVELRISQDLGAEVALRAAAETPIASLQLDETYAPVPVAPAPDQALHLARANDQVVVVRATVDAADLEALQARPDVVAVHRDAPIAPFAAPASVTAPAAALATVCDTRRAVGDLPAVAEHLAATELWNRGLRGTGVVIGIVDGGITAKGRTARAGETPRIDRVVGGWPEASWGTTAAAWGEHGNMTATDALGLAPDAQLLDIRISDASGGGAVSNALAGIDWALTRFRATGTPQILSNSWGIYQAGWEPGYARDPQHPFTRKVVEAIDAGMLVLFAAGNCGEVCPDGRCGVDTGPGRSIWGANGHPRVITVGGVRLDDAWIGYSSQGPAALAADKPDVCAITHFRGYMAVDTGTSAACPVAAGVVALLKQAAPELKQDTARAALRATATDLGAPGWDGRLGAGVLHAARALAAISPRPTWTPLRRAGGADADWYRGVAALAAADGTLDLFGVGVDSKLRHARVGTAGVSAPTVLDGVVVSPPAAARRLEGGVEVFAIGDGTSLFRRSLDRDVWSRWERFGTGRWLYGAAVTVTADGELDVFAVGTDSRLRQLRSDGATLQTTDLGGTCLAAPTATIVAGRTHVATIGPGNFIFTRSLAGGAWTPWTQIGSGRALHGLALTASGQTLHLLAIGTDSGLYHATRDGSEWSRFTRVAGAPATSAPAAAGSLDALLIGRDGALHRARFA